MKLRVLIIFIILSGCTESNYDQCRLDRVGEATSNLAIAEIRNICRKLHPIDKESIPIRRDLSTEELQKIENDKASGGAFDLFQFDYYNGNSKLAISEITIEIKIVGRDQEDSSSKPSVRVYKDETYAEPLSVGEFSERIIFPKENEKLTWEIIAAKGYVPSD